MHARRMFALSAVVACLLGTPLAPASAASDPDSPLGVNLGKVVDYGDEDPFRNVMLQSREWLTQCVAGADPGCSQSKAFDTGEQSKLVLDSKGWVRRIPARADSPVFTRVATIMQVSDERHNDYSGTYEVRYKGQGTMEYSGGARLVSRGKGRDVISVGSTGNLILAITKSNPRNYVRDITVVRRGGAPLASQPFSQTWLDRLRPFRTLRFMDWMRTNNSVAYAFSARPKPTDARYTTDKGVPIEIMTAAANATGAEPWFTMPHWASDDFVRSFAAVVKDTLAPGRKVYLEHSNEVWNDVFVQGSEIDALADREFAPSSDSFFTRRMDYHGKRTADICRIWREVLGSGRVVCVLAAQAANTFTADEALTCPLWRDDPDNPQQGRTCQEQGIDAIAIAPYFGSYLGDPEQVPRVRGMSLDRLFAEINAQAIPEAAGWIREYDALAAERGVQLLAYEGGQHLVGPSDDDRLTALFVSANRDPRMGQAYDSYLAQWRGAAPLGTTTLFNHFNFAERYGVFGSWGALEYVEQPTTPKYTSLTGYAATSCWWAGCRVS